MSLTLMTKLEAVNAMLESIWETPISTLEVAGIGSVAMAKRILDKTNIVTQTKGWDFNTDFAVVLAPDVAGSINLPANCLHVDPDGADTLRSLVQRGTRLYDKDERTFVFTKAVSVKMVSYLDWDDLPQAFRSYVAIAAARIFKDKWTSAESSTPATQEETDAMTILMENDADTRDNNMFRDSYSVASIIDR